jgi:hypothetical protein
VSHSVVREGKAIFEGKWGWWVWGWLGWTMELEGEVKRAWQTGATASLGKEALQLQQLGGMTGVNNAEVNVDPSTCTESALVRVLTEMIEASFTAKFTFPPTLLVRNDL